MSRAWAAVRFEDGTIKFTIYHGGGDYVWPALADSFTWQRSQPWRVCSCGQAETVEIADNYGGAEYWQGLACRHCLALTEDSITPPLRAARGLPEWAEAVIGA
jgi:hypothetical protein